MLNLVFGIWNTYHGAYLHHYVFSMIVGNINFIMVGALFAFFLQDLKLAKQYHA